MWLKSNRDTWLRSSEIDSNVPRRESHRFNFHQYIGGKDSQLGTGTPRTWFSHSPLTGRGLTCMASSSGGTMYRVDAHLTLG